MPFSLTAGSEIKLDRILGKFPKHTQLMGHARVQMNTFASLTILRTSTGKTFPALLDTSLALLIFTEAICSHADHLILNLNQLSELILSKNEEWLFESNDYVHFK